MTVLVVELISIWPAAEFLAERDVPDTLLRQGSLERPRIEVRDISGARGGPYIGDDVYAVPLKQAQEDVESNIRVPH
jgi:hypothetical protein